MNARPLAALATPVALAVAGAVSATLSADAPSRASTLYLTWISAGVLALLAVTASRSSRVVAVAALAACGALVFLPRAVPLPAAALAVILAGALGLSLIERARTGEATRSGALLGMVAAAQLSASGPELFLAPGSLRLWLSLAGATLIVTLLLERTAARRPEAALALALASFSAGPGWSLAGCAGVALGTLGVSLAAARRSPALSVVGVAAGALVAWTGSGPAWLAVTVAGLAAVSLAVARAPRRAALAALSVAALLALIAGGLPWRRQRPLEAALEGALAPPFRTVATPVRGRPVVLDLARPRFESALGVGDPRALVVVSYLTNSAGLPCGTPVARVILERAGREVFSTTLEVGRETSEWAATRPDVAATIACPAPPPEWSWIPAEGRHLGSTYSGRIDWGEGLAPDRLRIEREPRLPEETALAIFQLGVER